MNSLYYALWIGLFAIAAVGMLLGLFYYLKPEIAVNRRLRKAKLPARDKDPQFQKWLQQEFQTQVNKTKRIGKTLFFFEALWLVVIIYLFTHGAFTNK